MSQELRLIRRIYAYVRPGLDQYSLTIRESTMSEKKPVLILLYLIAYVDRSAVGFAKLHMVWSASARITPSDKPEMICCS